MVQSREIFVVHGHDEAMKQSVGQRMLEKLDLKPIILDERPNNGRTIIEKFEAHSASVGFAIVLLTADDVGGADKDALEPRAPKRHFRVGVFMGKLERKRVCVLQKPDVKFPSDIHGLVWIGFDDASGWKLKLASEIKASGIEVDLNLKLSKLAWQAGMSRAVLAIAGQFRTFGIMIVWP